MPTLVKLMEAIAGSDLQDILRGANMYVLLMMAGPFAGFALLLLCLITLYVPLASLNE